METPHRWKINADISFNNQTWQAGKYMGDLSISTLDSQRVSGFVRKDVGPKLNGPYEHGRNWHILPTFRHADI